MLQVDIQKTWVLFSSIVLAFAFMFGNSVKTVYESVIYLFVVHPFDVGDKIIVDSVTSKVRLWYIRRIYACLVICRGSPISWSYEL